MFEGQLQSSFMHSLAMREFYTAKSLRTNLNAILHLFRFAVMQSILNKSTGVLTYLAGHNCWFIRKTSTGDLSDRLAFDFIVNSLLRYWNDLMLVQISMQLTDNRFGAHEGNEKALPRKKELCPYFFYLWKAAVDSFMPTLDLSN